MMLYSITKIHSQVDFVLENNILIVLRHMGMATILINGPRPFCLNFLFPDDRRLHMKFVENWPRIFRKIRYKAPTDKRIDRR